MRFDGMMHRQMQEAKQRFRTKHPLTYKFRIWMSWKLELLSRRLGVKY